MGEGAWAGGSYGERATCLLAPNPGSMTLDGTNTWVLREPGAGRSVVIDPGPIEDGHLDLVDEAAGDVGLVLLTHHHFDHSEVAAELAERKGCVVRAFDPALCAGGGEPLVDGEVVEVDGLSLEVVHIPGHTADSIGFHLPAERVLLTGDMVLGRGTTVVAWPDGQLAPYLASIARMRALCDADGPGSLVALWPGHGPVLADPAGVLDHYLTHRHQRLDQVRAALTELGVGPGDEESWEGDGLPRRVTETVYADVDPSLWDYAEWSVRAQLAYLGQR